jgi:hypothetical protein
MDGERACKVVANQSSSGCERSRIDSSHPIVPMTPVMAEICHCIKSSDVGTMAMIAAEEPRFL